MVPGKFVCNEVGSSSQFLFRIVILNEVKDLLLGSITAASEGSVMSVEPEFNYSGDYDENLPLPAFLTMEQYTHVFFRPDAHFIDGKIIPRQLGDYTHGSTVGAVTYQLHDQCESNELSCCISLRLQISPSRIRVCDIAVLANTSPYEEVPTVAPFIAIEVLSPDQSPEDEAETLADYLVMGVQSIWLIDPIRRFAYTYGATGLQAAPLVLTVPGTPIRLDLNDIFLKLDEKIAAHKRL
jgi:Uma2 family endonuclease